MGDIRLHWDPGTGTADIRLIAGGLELGHDLETAVLVSLFTEGLADPEDVVPPAQASDRRGWWADTYQQPPDPIGCKLYQGFWRQATPDTVNWARDQAAKALQWLIDDGIAIKVDVDAQLLGKGGLALRCVITEPGGRATPFTYVWNDAGQ